MQVVLIAFAFVFALFAAFQWPGEGRVKWGWLAMSCYFASILFTGVRALL